MCGTGPLPSAVDSNSRMSLFRQHWYSSVSRAWHAVPSAVCYMARKQTSISVWSCIVKSFRTRPKLMYARMFYNSRLSEGLSSHGSGESMWWTRRSAIRAGMLGSTPDKRRCINKAARESPSNLPPPFTLNTTLTHQIAFVEASRALR